MTSNIYHLYKYKALPISSDGHLFQLSGTTDLIAMSEDKSRSIKVSSSIMDSCHKVGFNILCSFPSVVVEQDYPMYLNDIFLGPTWDIFSTCSVVILKNQFMIHHLIELAFVSYPPKPLTASETCGPKISERILVALQSFEDVDYNALFKGGGSWRLFCQYNDSILSCGSYG